MIEMGKRYQTEQGYPVRVISIDRKGRDYCVIGLVTLSSTEESVECWKIDGTRENHGCDLVPLVTRHKGWCVVRNNIWWDGSTVVHPTPEAAWADKELADKRNPNEEHRVAQVYWES